jgi:hypothetical protein
LSINLHLFVVTEQLYLTQKVDQVLSVFHQLILDGLVFFSRS